MVNPYKMDGLKVDQITKSYQGKEVLRQVSFEVHAGEIWALLGPSGCGKSTLLKIIAGLESPDHGQIFWNGQPQNDIPVHQRKFGLMFQDFMLFPHKDVFSNVAFGLEMRHWAKDEIKGRVNELLSFVGLPGYGGRDVTTLSGGEQQRVALARSLAPKPRLLMLDEPVGSLDRTLRERLLVALKMILKDLNQTALYVTHDQEEAFALADRVVVMSPGEVAQIGTPESIFCHPASVFVAHFLGFNNIFHGIRQHNSIQTPIGDFNPQGTNFEKVSDGDNFTLLIRPDQMKTHPAETSEGHRYQSFSGVIREQIFRGSQYQVRLDVNGFELHFDFRSAAELPGVGKQLKLYYDPNDAIQLLE